MKKAKFKNKPKNRTKPPYSNSKKERKIEVEYYGRTVESAYNFGVCIDRDCKNKARKSNFNEPKRWEDYKRYGLCEECQKHMESM